MLTAAFSAEHELSQRNLTRSMAVFDSAMEKFIDRDHGMAMSRYYNPFDGTRSEETGSVWMYTASIEAANAILSALETIKDAGDTSLYDACFAKYSAALDELISGLEYYKGTFELVGFTQTREWTVYAVDRVRRPGRANVKGKLNVYDDQMWLVRELIESYRLTGNEAYLATAEYLTEYVMDGWDCTMKRRKERGGITWGPGYYSKHSCSNGPIISPLVWLHEIYRGKPDTIVYRYIAKDGRTRMEREMTKDEYYLMFAEKVYSWQKKNLLYKSGEAAGLFADNLNDPVVGKDIQLEEVDGTLYRKPSDLGRVGDPAISYNTGTMISGASDLMRVTGKASYLKDMKSYTDKSFAYFAKRNDNGYYEYPTKRFWNWFNGVLLRSYVEAGEYYDGTDRPVGSFQDNLDYAWDNHLVEGLLPTSLLDGWDSEAGKNRAEAMFEFTFAAEYAVLSRYQVNKME